MRHDLARRRLPALPIHIGSEHGQRLGDRLADGHARIEAGQRILEDDLQILPQRLHLLARGIRDVAAQQGHRIRRWIEQLQHAARQRGLAAAAFADDAQRLAGRSEKLTPSTARSGTLWPNSPPGTCTGKVTCRSSTSSSGFASGGGGAAIVGRDPIRAIEPRHRIEQHARIVVLRRSEHLVDRPALHRLAVPHHHHAIRHARDHAHVVRDQHQPGLRLALQLVHQVEHLRLHRDVERRRRLVRQQQRRLAQHGRCDHHPLAHAAGQFVRKLVQPPPRLGNAHALQPLDDALFGRRAPYLPVARQHLGHLRADRHVRRQRRQRILEDHGDPRRRGSR